MAKTIEQIQKEVQQIKNETVAKQNTATRVGGALEDMVEKMEADSISVEGKLSNLGSKVGEFGKVVLAENETDALYVTDGDGNVVTKTNKEGFFATAIKILKDGNLTDILDLLKNVGVEGISSDFNDSLYITDSNGYVFFSITKNTSGEYELNYVGKGSGGGGGDSRYKNFELFTLGDSLCQGGTWQTRCADNLGCVFSQERNIKGGSALSVGGTTSFGTDFDCMPWRAKHLIDSGYISGVGSNAIIVLENVNDGARTFDTNAKAFNLSTPIEGYAYDDFSSTMLNNIPSEKRKLDACLRLTKTQVGKNLAITTLPTKEGDITLKVGWSGPGVSNYNIHVVPQSTDTATRQYIIDKILEYNYSGTTDTLSDDGQSVDFSNGTTNYTMTVQFTDTGGTGMRVSITDTTNAKTSIAKFFKGSTLADWTNIDAWQEGLSYSEGWKTTIEMLQVAFPDAKIIVSMFPSLAYTADDYKLANGLYDVKAYYDSQRMSSQRTMRTNLSAIADYYTIPFADLFKDSGISISNMLQFYQANANVHPKKEGYERWGDVMASLIRRTI